MKIISRVISLLFVLAPTWLVAANVSQLYDAAPDINTCYEGTLKQAEKTAVLNAVNYVRSLHHLEPVEYNNAGDTETAKSALISAANGQLTHTPAATMFCYSEQGYQGAYTSNLHLFASSSNSSLPTSEGSIAGFMIDDDVESLGHRRWIIDPFLKSISFGRVDSNVSISRYFYTGMTLKVVNKDVRTCTNLDNDFVAYPYGTYPSVYAKTEWYWSFSALVDKCDRWSNDQVDYSTAVITVTNSSGTSMSVNSVNYNTNGYGLSNIIQWKVANAKAEESYRVNIQRVMVAGQSKNFSYDVKITSGNTTTTPVTPTTTPTTPTTPTTSNTTSGKINGISTRAPVGTTAEKYMMAGVFVQGTTQKRALVRATGKGLMKQGVNTTLDAKLEVYQLGNTSVLVDKNDDWQQHSSYSAVQAVGGASDDLDAALITGLDLGYYSMVVMPSGGSMTSGGGSSEGIGLIEVYDNDHSSESKLSGISTRSYVGNLATDYMYAGLAIQGNVKVLIRGLGKGLVAQGVSGALDDAMITVRKADGTIIDSNDNWQNHSSSATLTQRGQSPKESSDAAMIINLSEGLYTIEVKSARGGSGVALIEVYEIIETTLPGNSSNATGNGTSERIQKTAKTFVDTQTGLEWMASDIINLERDAAISRCNSIDYGGYQDWRLSTNSELSTFVKALSQSSVKPSYLGSFSGCTAGITTDGYVALTSDYVPFAEPINFTGYASVRCVRASR